VTTVGQEELGGTFTVTNVPTDAGADAALIWPTSGTWTFNDIENPGAGISRVAGGVTQNIEVNVSTTALTLTFTVDDPNARTEGFLDSPWTFNMVPQQ
ncbi:MAG: hypothetical protein KI790_20915, partial [Cyclobacteriaceae bacterium]|nr:hypothetical protein [Cyclobacteriaceae bacterium HetDA_MAG_MS6]